MGKVTLIEARGFPMASTTAYRYTYRDDKYMWTASAVADRKAGTKKMLELTKRWLDWFDYLLLLT